MSGNTAMSKTQVQLKSLADLLESKRGSLNALVANGLKPDRLIKVVVAAASKTPKLLECTQVSIYRSLTEAASLGIEPNGPLGHGYLVPYMNKGVMECQFIISYRGMIDISRRSGKILSIEARAVYAGDDFEFEFGLAPKCRHVPKAQDQDDSKITHFYAVAHLEGGGTQFEVMTKAQVDAVRAKSKMANFGMWKEHYPEGGKKTAIRRLFKYLPVSIEVAEQVQKEDRLEAGERTIDVDILPEADGPDGEVIVETSMTEKLKNQIGGEA